MGLKEVETVWLVNSLWGLDKWLDNQETVVRFQTGARGFFLLLSLQTDS